MYNLLHVLYMYVAAAMAVEVLFPVTCTCLSLQWCVQLC